jgi:hypothetical protein
MNTWFILTALVASTTCLEMKGINFVGMPYTRVHLSDPYAKQALENLVSTGANWISLPVTFFQDFKNSSQASKAPHPFILESGINECSPEKDYVQLIKEAKALGLKVMLQFHVQENKPFWPDSREIGDYWGFYNPYVWFPRYYELIESYVNATKDSGVDMISLGHNFMALSYHENHWKELAQKIKNITDIPLTYSAAFGDEERKSGFWDQLDYVSVFPKLKSKTTEAMEVELKEFSRALSYMNKLWKKPVIVTRVAACSHPSQEISQSALFRAVHDSIKDLDFVKGVFFGDWAADIMYHDPNDPSYNIQNKASQKVVTELFDGSGDTVQLPEEVAAYKLNCDCFRQVTANQ